MTLYHYTSQKGYSAILATELLLPSLRTHNPKDARQGDGEYLHEIASQSEFSPRGLNAAEFEKMWNSALRKGAVA